MTVTFTNASWAAQVAPLDLITSALSELNVISAGDPADPLEIALGLEKLQRLIDRFNATEEAIYSRSFLQFNIQANHSPHTIGPTGDFVVPARPVRIQSASWILNAGTSNPVDSPIRIKDKDWWAALPTKSQQSSIITHLYYDPSMPNGALNFWPISNIANAIRLEMWNSIGQAVNLVSKLYFPQGYWDAIVLTLAVDCISAFDKKDVSPILLQRQRDACRAIFSNNEESPRIDTSIGMPDSRRGGRPDFNFLTGLRD